MRIRFKGRSPRQLAATLVILATLVVLGGMLTPPLLIGQTSEKTVSRHFNIPLPTIGGAQLWTDRMHRGGERIQQNAISGHFRLLDEGNVRRGWGSEADMTGLLDQRCPEPPPPSQKPIAVLLHGLMRTDASMKPLESRLRESDYDQVIRFGYASTRSTLADSAAALRQVLEGQHPDAEFCFVGHSMGNIVLRHMIGDLQRDSDPKGILPRCRGMVMLGPPNQGAMIARRLGKTGVFEWVAGPGAMQLGERWPEVESRLSTPPFPFAIVAGKLEKPIVSNPLVEGDGDFVVALEEAKLEGAETVKEVPVLHSFLMNDPSVQQWTIEFLDRH